VPEVKRSRWWVQALLIVWLAWVYDATTNLAPVRVHAALAHARGVLRIEQWLGIDVERSLDHWLATHHTLGLVASGTEWAGGVLADYAINSNWNISGRAEYETSSGGDGLLIYGPKSKAWSLTLTPTYQNKLFFIRADASYAAVSDAFYGFGKNFNKDDQMRVMLEAGIVF